MNFSYTCIAAKVAFLKRGKQHMARAQGRKKKRHNLMRYLVSSQQL
jgi:hypothetical protein